MSTTLIIDGLTTWLLWLGALLAVFALFGWVDEAVMRRWRRRHLCMSLCQAADGGQGRQAG